MQRLLSIDLKQYAAAMQHIVKQYQELAMRDQENIANFQPQEFFKQINVLSEYPGKFNLQQALFSKNPSRIYAVLNHFHKWIYEQDYNSQLKYRKIRDAIYVYVNTLEKPQEFDYNNHLLELYEATNANMRVIADMLEASVQQIPNWSSYLLIEASPAYDDYGKNYAFEAADDAIIHVGDMSDAPTFSLWKIDNQWAIEDVLEAGDEDFFPNPQIQNDYFKLINEIRNPGSSQKGKVLTLYTARPVQDRRYYTNTKTLPINVFLANSFDHVEGLARDLSSKGSRDIWKVRVNSKYLTQTLDGPIKYYQVTDADTPLISIELLSTGQK